MWAKVSRSLGQTLNDRRETSLMVILLRVRQLSIAQSKRNHRFIYWCLPNHNAVGRVEPHGVARLNVEGTIERVNVLNNLVDSELSG